MAQVVATRLIHGSLVANPGSGSPQSFADKLKPGCGFMANVLAQTEKKRSRLGVVHVSTPIVARRSAAEVIPVSPEDLPKATEQNRYSQMIPQLGDTSVGVWSKPTVRRKTKIVCTIGPSTDTKEMIWKLAEAGMNVARLNMSHGDHASHHKVIDLVKEYNAQVKDNVIAIMLDTKTVNSAGGPRYSFANRHSRVCRRCSITWSGTHLGGRIDRVIAAVETTRRSRLLSNIFLTYALTVIDIFPNFGA